MVRLLFSLACPYSLLAAYGRPLCLLVSGDCSTSLYEFWAREGRYRYANTAKVALYLNGIMLAYGGLLQFIPVPLLNLLISLLLFGAYYGLSLSAALQTTVLKGVSACLITVLISWGFVIAIFAGLFAVCIVAYT